MPSTEITEEEFYAEEQPAQPATAQPAQEVSAMSAQYQVPQRTGPDPYASMFQAGSPQQLQSAVNQSAEIGKQQAASGEFGQYVTPYFEKPGQVSAPPRVALSEEEKRRAERQLAISAGIVGSTVAPMFLPEALTTAAATGGALTRIGAGGVIGATGGGTAGAIQAIPDIVRGDYGEAAKNALLETAIGTVAGPVVSEAARPLVRLGASAYEAFKPTSDKIKRSLGEFVKERFKTGIASTYRPIKAYESDEIRNIIFESTGETVPVGLAEAIGSPEIANAMRTASSKTEPTPEQIEAVKKSVLFAASRLGDKNLGLSPDDLASATINILKKEIGTVSKPFEDAVKKVSNELSSSIKKGFETVQNDFNALIPGTAATPTTVGQNVRANIQSGLKYLKDTDNANYGPVYANPAYDKLLSQNIKNVQAVANEIDASAVQQLSATPEEASLLVDQFGVNIPSQDLPKTVGIPSTYPEGTRGFIAAIGKMVPNQKIDALRKLRTQIGSSIGDDTVLPGLGDRAKLQLYSALSKDISGSIDNLPTSTLKNQLQKADKFHRENVDFFAGREIQSIIKEVGAEGGVGPASIASKFEGADAPTFIGQLKKASNPEEAARIDSVAKEFLFNQAGKSGVDPVTGEVAIGKVISYIEGLAPEIQKSYFTNVQNIKNLAKKQSALQKLSTQSGDISSSLTVDPRLLSEALGAGGKEIENLVEIAAKRSGEQEKLFRGTVLGALKKGSSGEITDAISQNPLGFVRNITDGTFSAQQAKSAFDLIGRENPTLLSQLQFQYVNDLMNKVSTGGKLNSSELASKLAAATSGSLPSNDRMMADAVLGSSRTETIRSVMENLAKLEKVRAPLAQSDPFIEALARGGGAVAGTVLGRGARIGPIGASNQANQMVKLVPRIRYKIASWVLTTPELRRLAMKPLNELTSNEVNTVLRGAAAAVAAYEGDDSPDADAIMEVAQ